MYKNLLYIIIIFVFLVSCKSDDDSDSEPSQLARIATFVESQYTDKYRVIDGAVYVANINERQLQGARITAGDSVELYFAIYRFYSRIDSLVYTNIESVAREQNFDFQLLSFEPMKIKYGTTPLFKGMGLALDKLIEGDSSYVFMPSTYAYGDIANGVVPSNNSIALFLNVTKIKSNE